MARMLINVRLNKVQEDFESLRDYNDYLETVEEITFNLIYKVDVEATERRLKQWEESQKAERNDTTRSFQPDPSLPSDTAHVVLKKGAAQRKALATATGNNAPEPFGASDGTDTGTGFSFKGLKKYVPPEPEKPFDPYGGYSVQPQYYALRDDYDVDWLTKSKDDINAQAGGWDIHSFYSRALCDAFSGFGVFIEEEVNQREMDVSMDASVGTQAAAAVAAGSREVNMDDVF
jgi:CDK-activating kinase assembly factor MAT1